MGTLDNLAAVYVGDRLRRGEIVEATAEDLRSRLATLCRSFGDEPLDALNETALETWLGTIGWMKPSARRAYVSTVHGFCQWLVRQHLLPADPTLELGRIREPRRVARPLSMEKVGRLLHAHRGAREQAVIWLMLGEGLRCGEVAGLRVDDLDRDAATLFVKGKGSHERLVPTPPVVVEALVRYQDQLGWLPGPMVRPASEPTARRHLHGHNVSQEVTRWLYAAGVKERPRDGITPHALRHTCASGVFRECHDLSVVQHLLGHANQATTSGYVAGAGLDAIRRALEGWTFEHLSHAVEIITYGSAIVAA